MEETTGWLPSARPFFTPQRMPPAVKPMGAVTPPEICFIVHTSLSVPAQTRRSVPLFYSKAGGFVQPQHEIHVLYRCSAGALAQVVKRETIRVCSPVPVTEISRLSYPEKALAASMPVSLPQGATRTMVWSS